jgi:hypothetical protein
MKYLKTIAEFNSFQTKNKDVMYTHIQRDMLTLTKLILRMSN